MKHWHCHDCHHEWDGSGACCDWCGGIGYVLEEQTPFGRFMEAWARGWRPPGWPYLISRDGDTNSVDSAK